MCEREPSGFPFAFNQGMDCSLVYRRNVPPTKQKKTPDGVFFCLVGLQGLEPWTNRL